MAHIKITVNNTEIDCPEGDSVLDALLRAGIAVSHGCHQGLCQSCMVRSLRGVPPPAAQQGLNEALRHQNYFLACQCYPQQDMTIGLTQADDYFSTARVVAKQALGPETMQLTLHVAADVGACYPGQFVNLRREDGLTRSYAVAGISADRRQLLFHIRRIAGGRFSQWLYQELGIGDQLEVSDPRGLCYYLPSRPEQNLLLIGTGCGLAPLAGIVREALRHGHHGQIHLYHGSREMDGLYWLEEMQTLALQYANFRYIPCVSRGIAPIGIAVGRANDVAMAGLPSLRDWRLYLSGHPDMVAEARRQAFLKGIGFADVYAEAFHVASSTLD